MILSSSEILKQKNNIVIKPFNIKQLNPNSYDLTLNPTMYVYTGDVLDPKKENSIQVITIPEEGYTLQPGEVYIASTNEYTETYNYVPCLADKSSLARLGISTHFNAGFGDNGFRGHWTIEIAVTKPTILYPNMKICQIYYQPVVNRKDSRNKQHLYAGKYQDQTGAVSSRSFQDKTL